MSDYQKISVISNYPLIYPSTTKIPQYQVINRQSALLLRRQNIDDKKSNRMVIEYATTQQAAERYMRTRARIV